MPISAAFLPNSNHCAGVIFTYCCFALQLVTFSTSSTASLAAAIEVDGILRDKLPEGSGNSNGGDSVLLVVSFLPTGLKYFKIDIDDSPLTNIQFAFVSTCHHAPVTLIRTKKFDGLILTV